MAKFTSSLDTCLLYPFHFHKPISVISGDAEFPLLCLRLSLVLCGLSNEISGGKNADTPSDVLITERLAQAGKRLLPMAATDKQLWVWR